MEGQKGIPGFPTLPRPRREAARGTANVNLAAGPEATGKLFRAYADGHLMRRRKMC